MSRRLVGILVPTWRGEEDLAKHAEKDSSEESKETSSDTENPIILEFPNSSLEENKQTNTPQLFLLIPRLTEMLGMRIKIPPLLHQGCLLLENKQSWWAGEQIYVFSLSPSNHPTQSQKCTNSQKTKAYQAPNPQLWRTPSSGGLARLPRQAASRLAASAPSRAAPRR